jgi:hypothetical protein
MKNFRLIAISVIIASIVCCNAEINKGHAYVKWQVDTNGNKIKKSEYKRFDENGNLIKWIQYLENENTLTDSFTYVFQATLKTEEKRFSDNSLFSISKYEYYSNNKLSKENKFDKDNNLESYSKHKFIDSEEIVENYSVKDGLYSIDTIVYNEKNKILTETTYMTDGTWFQKDAYEYDSKGILIKQQSQVNPIFDGAGIVEYNFKNNEQNRPIKSNVILPDKSEEYYIFEYSDN